MERDDFKMRTVTYKDGIIEVNRTRTSKGFSSISLTVGDKTITFNRDSVEPIGYEMNARTAADLLNKMVDNPCNIDE